MIKNSYIQHILNLSLKAKILGSFDNNSVVVNDIDYQKILNWILMRKEIVIYPGGGGLAPCFN